MRNTMIGLFLLSACLVAAAQSIPQLRQVSPIRSVAANDPNAARYTGDPTQQLQKRIVVLGKKNRALEGRVATLEAALRDMRAATTFTCATPVASRNGSGVVEECSPFACNYIDGRCRTTAATSDHCAPAFAMVGGRCESTTPAPDSCEGASWTDIDCW